MHLKLLKKLAKLLLVNIVALTLGADCKGPLPGTVFNIAHSYGENHQLALTNQFRCGEAVPFYKDGRLIADNPPTWVREGTMLDLLPGWTPLIAEAEGPVTVVLHAGNGDEILPVIGLSPQDVADNATLLIEGLLAIREDISVVLMTGVGWCTATFHTLIEIEDERFEVSDLSGIDMLYHEGSALMDDGCHPSVQGATQRISELIRTSELAAAGLCY
jgi:hypothetical protein